MASLFIPGLHGSNYTEFAVSHLLHSNNHLRDSVLLSTKLKYTDKTLPLNLHGDQFQVFNYVWYDLVDYCDRSKVSIVTTVNLVLLTDSVVPIVRSE